MNIVYCINSINYAGGTERVTVTKANELSNIWGNRVFLVVTDDNGDYPFLLDRKVKVINLGVNYYLDDWHPGVKAKFSQFRKKLKHRKMLKMILESLSPDIVISTGQSEKLFLSRNFLKKRDVLFIREFHFSTNYRLLFAKSTFDFILAKIKNFIDFKFISKRFDAIICLTPKDISENWEGHKNVYFIPNPLTIPIKKTSKIRHEYKKIITVGRLTAIKNYSSLIRSFALIAHKYLDWTLEIYGDGDQREMLNAEINGFGLSNQIILKGYSSDIASKFANADIFVMTSLTEGFPLVLFEAMSNNLPVVSYDCPYGPSYIIDENINGFLVELNNEVELADKIELLINNEELRIKMGMNGFDKALNYLPELIALKWMAFFTELQKKQKLHKKV